MPDRLGHLPGGGQIVADDTTDSLTATEDLEQVFLRVTTSDVVEDEAAADEHAKAAADGAEDVAENNESTASAGDVAEENELTAGHHGASPTNDNGGGE